MDGNFLVPSGKPNASQTTFPYIFFDLLAPGVGMLLHRSNLDHNTFPKTRQKLVICGSLLLVGGFLPVVCIIGFIFAVIPIIGWIIGGLSSIGMMFGAIVMLLTRILALVWSILNYQMNSPKSDTVTTTATTTAATTTTVTTGTTAEVVAVPIATQEPIATYELPVAHEGNTVTNW